MERKNDVTIVTKFSSGQVDEKTGKETIREINISDDILTNSSPVEFQELYCRTPEFRTLSTYNYNRVTTLEARGLEKHTPLHRHDYFEIIFPLSDGFEMQIETTLLQLKRYDVCVLDRVTRHNEQFKQNDLIFYLHLSTDYLSSEPKMEQVSLRSFGRLSEFFYKDLGEPLHRRNFIHFHYTGKGRAEPRREAPPIYRILAQMRGEFEHKEAGYQLLEYALVFRLFSVLTDPACYRAEYVSLGSDNRASLALSARQILERTNRRMTKNELSEKLNYDAEYINRVFKRHYGYSIPEYNRRRCLQTAADMLINTELPVSEICRRIDYTNRTHFYQMFEERYGCSPLEYRARQISGAEQQKKEDKAAAE